jgi:hypothetical protein
MPDAGSQVVAGIRAGGGVLIFVADAPSSLEIGSSIRCSLDGKELCGVVSIPPRLIVWRDPAARCATFVAVEEAPAPPIQPSDPATRQAIARFGSVEAGSGGYGEQDMLTLAWEEIDRLDR